MKKTALILSILAFFHSTGIKSQSTDTILNPHMRNFYYLSLRTGLIAGYHFLSSDSANITLSQPNEIHLRFFPKGEFFFRSFFDAELQTNSLMFSERYLAKGGAIRIGWGKITKNLTHSWRVHLGFEHLLISKNRPDLLEYKNLLVFGYTFETNGIPLTVDYLYPVRNGISTSATILLMGVKIPIVEIELKKREDRLIYSQ